MAKEISYKVMKPMEVLSENNKGYTKEINLVSWNYASAKLDIREWHPEHKKCGKGIALSESEGRKLMEALIKFYAEIDKD